MQSNDREGHYFLLLVIHPVCFLIGGLAGQIHAQLLHGIHIHAGQDDGGGGFNFTDLRNMYPYRKDNIKRYKDTKKRLWKLSKRIKPGELSNWKYNLAWLYFLILGWL